jgi:UDP-N-acetylmuramate--alanine ligase
MNLKEPIHFIGIGGTGMNPLAFLLNEKGMKVQGSDLAQNDTIKKLHDHGITVYSNHREDNVPEAGTVVFSTAIKDSNPELAQAKSLGLTVLHRSDLLKLISEDYKPIFVAGSHGKTSTAGILTHILKFSGHDPCAIIGGNLLNYDSYYLNGSGEYFVAEADESDGSFLKYNPFISIITNIDNDHLDHYGDLESIAEAFKDFAIKTDDEEGLKVYGWDSKLLRDIARDTGDFTSYGSLIGCHNRILSANYHHDRTKFKAILGTEIQEFECQLLGKHSIQNCLAAVTVAMDLGIDIQKIKESLQDFKGMGRRLEIISENESYTLINDYAHNPGKISSAIEAVRLSYPKSNIISVFQPHRYSRLETMYDLFASSFVASDQVIVTPIFAAGEKSVENINHEKLSRDISHLSQIAATPVDHFNDIYKSLNVKHSAHNVILLLGAGDIDLARFPIMEQLNCSNDF